MQHGAKDEHDDLDNNVAEVNHHNYDDSGIMTKVAMAMAQSNCGWRSCG